MGWISAHPLQIAPQLFHFFWRLGTVSGIFLVVEKGLVYSCSGSILIDSPVRNPENSWIQQPSELETKEKKCKGDGEREPFCVAHLQGDWKNWSEYHFPLLRHFPSKELRHFRPPENPIVWTGIVTGTSRRHLLMHLVCLVRQRFNNVSYISPLQNFFP